MTDRDLVQLALYALVLERVRGEDVDAGYVDLIRSCERVEVELSGELRERALRLRDEAQAAVVAGLYPERAERCRGCELAAECRLLFL